MKPHKEMQQKAKVLANKALYQAVLSLQNEEECSQFFSDLCTPSELEAMVDRWAVVPFLNEGLPYRKIHDITGVSVTTIGRVARFLTIGNGGYKTALDRLGPFNL